MKRTIIATVLILMLALLIGCTKQSDQPQTAMNQPQPSTASQTQESQTAPQPQAVPATQRPSPQPSVESVSDTTSAVKSCPEPYRTYCDDGDTLGESFAQWKADNPKLDCVPQGEGKWKNCTFQYTAYDSVGMNTETVSFLNGRLFAVAFTFDPVDRQKVQDANVQQFGEPREKRRMIWAWENSQSYITVEDVGLREATLAFSLKGNGR